MAMAESEILCAFFGHRDMDYSGDEERIKEVVAGLIERGVRRFIDGDRGNFDRLCAKVVWDLKRTSPQVTMTRAISYMPKAHEETPRFFDDSVYLLEKRVPPRYAIAETNKLIVRKADIIVSGVIFPYGGAHEAVSYAKRLGKEIIQIPHNAPPE